MRSRNIKAAKPQREIGLDILKGIVVLVMVFAHTIAFTHDSSSSLLETIRKFGDTVSFTTFLFASGASIYLAYLKHTVIDDDDVPFRIINRTLTLLLGYYFVAIISTLNSFPQQIDGIINYFFNIAFFVKVPGYTEFLVPFIIYSILLVPFKKVFKLIANSVLTGIFVGLVFYFLGFWAYKFVPDFVYKQLLFGQEGRYSFPLFQYFGVLLIGLSWGKWLIENKSNSKRAILAASSAFIMALSFFVIQLLPFTKEIVQMEQRWPPSLTFIIAGLVFSYFINAISLSNDIERYHKYFPIKFVTFLGRHVFVAFIVHIVILQLYSLADVGKRSNLGYTLLAYVIVMAATYFLSELIAKVSSVKKKGKTKLNYKMIFVFLALLVSTGSAKIYSKYDTKTEVPLIKEIIQEEPAQNYWYDDHYKWRQNIVLKNTSANKVEENGWMSIEFDHLALVTAKKSLWTGNDLKLVYFENKQFIDIPIRLEGNNTIQSKIIFEIFRQIEPSSNDDKYYLYYGDNLATSYTKDDRIESFNTNTPLSFEFDVEQQHPNFLSTKRLWYLKGNEVTSQEKTINLTFKPRDIEPNKIFDYSFSNTNIKGQLIQKNDFYEASINTDLIEPGSYLVQITDSKKEIKSNYINLNVSYPMYVLWTMDWEGYDCNNTYLDMIDKLADEFGVPITHFYNPRIHIAYTQARQDYLDNWVKMRQGKGDEIELHLHMFHDMMLAAGIEPKKDIHWNDNTDGKDVPATVYTQEEMEKVLLWSIDIFQDRNLGTPIAYRSGAWFANLDTLEAVENTGFLIDSSGREKYIWGKNKIPGYWDLISTTQPYKPSRTNQNSPNEPTFDLWEFPNNGGDSWWYTDKQLIQKFDENYNGNPLTERKAHTLLSHPHGFNVDDPKMRAVFAHIDNYTFESDNGPIKFSTLLEAYAGWKD